MRPRSSKPGSAAPRVVRSRRRARGHRDDEAAHAELDLLESARALLAKDGVRALELARSARQHALAGNTLLPYVAAALVIADLLDGTGDRLGAYRSLAVGWVTAGDKIGNELAASMFRAPLANLKTRWGAAGFDAVKSEYETARQRS